MVAKKIKTQNFLSCERKQRFKTTFAGVSEALGSFVGVKSVSKLVGEISVFAGMPNRQPIARCRK